MIKLKNNLYSKILIKLKVLGGKEVLIERTRYLLNEFGFITVFICPDGDTSQQTIIYSQDDNKHINTEEYFNAYFNYYKNEHSLFDEAKRRNIYELGKPYIKDLEGLEEPKDWEHFREELQKRIFTPRFYFYNRKYDVKIFRRGEIEDVVCNILKGILTVHINRLNKERGCY